MPLAKFAESDRLLLYSGKKHSQYKMRKKFGDSVAWPNRVVNPAR